MQYSMTKNMGIPSSCKQRGGGERQSIVKKGVLDDLRGCMAYDHVIVIGLLLREGRKELEHAAFKPCNRTMMLHLNSNA